MDERERSIAHGKAINADIAKRLEAYDYRGEVEQGISQLCDLVGSLQDENKRLRQSVERAVQYVILAHKEATEANDENLTKIAEADYQFIVEPLGLGGAEKDNG